MFSGKIKRFLASDTENMLYWISIPVILITAIIYCFHIWFARYTGHTELIECMMYKLAGLYCPGCGGTRALKSIIKGDIISSLYYNSFVTYGVIIYGWFFVSQTLQRITKGKIKGMKFRMAYIWIGVVVLLVQYLLKFIIPGYTL